MGADLLILFGSQTGNAQDVAEQLGRAAELRQLSTTVVAMDAFDMSRLHEQAATVFVASTTGQGETPDNMKRFWRLLLRKSLPADALGGMHHAVFGLGDSGYQQYNTVAKKLDRRLAALGSAALLVKGLGDDQHFSGYDSALFPWLEQLWPALRKLWPHKDLSVLPGSEGRLPRCKYTSTILNESPDASTNGSTTSHEQEVAAWVAFTDLEAAACGLSTSSAASATANSAGFGPERPYMASVIANQRITSPDHFQDTRHIELDLADSSLVYEPGDLLNILPRQNPAAVQRFLQRTGLSAQSVVRIEAAGSEATDGSGQFMQVAVGNLVAGALDIHGACPKRFFFEILAHFAAEPHEAERLLYFASSEGRDDLAQYNAQEGRTVLEVLEDFPSAQVPLQWLLSIVPRMKPRQFSIASSLRAHPKQAHITAAIVDFRTPHKRRKQGLCTAWLAQLSPALSAKPDSLQSSASAAQTAPITASAEAVVGLRSNHSHHPTSSSDDVDDDKGISVVERVPVWISKGVLRMPADLSKPLILVGPGTGVAPFRAFLEERAAVQAAGDHKIAPCHLYFGCRGPTQDFYYKEQWQRYVRDGVLAADGGLVTAFSREAGRKVYVTHKMRERAKQLSGLLTQGAAVYISGSATRMPQDVIAALESILAEQAPMAEHEAKAFMKALQSSGRCVIEAWS